MARAIRYPTATTVVQARPVIEWTPGVYLLCAGIPCTESAIARLNECLGLALLCNLGCSTLLNPYNCYTIQRGRCQTSAISLCSHVNTTSGWELNDVTVSPPFDGAADSFKSASEWIGLAWSWTYSHWRWRCDDKRGFARITAAKRNKQKAEEEA